MDGDSSTPASKILIFNNSNVPCLAFSSPVLVRISKGTYWKGRGSKENDETRMIDFYTSRS